jgi:calcineurin-like phosphoesterase family protein
MSETFFASDHHLQHAKLLTFLDAHGCLLRPEFSEIEEHDEYIIEQHNLTVGPKDTIYFLGDVVWKTNAKAKEQLSRLNGKKYLMVGNHDDVPWLSPYFEDVYLWKKFADHKIVASHIPLREEELSTRGGFQIHGHIHEKWVLKSDGTMDERYYNVAMEQIGFTPVSLEDAELFFKGYGT